MCLENKYTSLCVNVWLYTQSNNVTVEPLKEEIVFSPKQSDPLNSSGDGKLLPLSSVLSAYDSVCEYRRQLRPSCCTVGPVKQGEPEKG